VQKRPLLDLGAVESVAVVSDSQTGQPALQITFTPAGRLRFAELTKERNHQRIAILIDGKLREVPVIQDGMTVNFLRVNEGLSASEASDLAARMNAAIGGK
jgi:preprotein translocase subunit SecD